MIETTEIRVWLSRQGDVVQMNSSAVLHLVEHIEALQRAAAGCQICRGAVHAGEIAAMQRRMT